MTSTDAPSEAAERHLCPICVIPMRMEKASGRKKPGYQCARCGYDIAPSSTLPTVIYLAIGFVLLLLAASFLMSVFSLAPVAPQALLPGETPGRTP